MKKVPWVETKLVVKNCGVTRQPSGFRILPEWFSSIQDFDLWMILSGRAEACSLNGETFSLSRGSCLWLAPGQKYDFEVKEEELVTAWVHFDLYAINGEVLKAEQVEFPSPYSEILNSEMAEQIIRRIVLLSYEYREKPETSGLLALTADQLLKGLLMEFELAQAQEASLKEFGIARHHRKVISEALSWIYFNPVEAASAGTVARKFGYSLKHFCRVFRQISGKTPSRAIIEARVEHARELLTESALNITEIAERLNYENAFYFSKQFKKITGESPTQYRAKAGKGTRA